MGRGCKGNGASLRTLSFVFFLSFLVSCGGSDSGSFSGGVGHNPGAGTFGVTVSPASVSVTEGGATAAYTLVLTSAPASNVTVNITSPLAGTQLTLSRTSLGFTTGNWSVPQSVTVTAVNDTVAEGTQTATVTHTVTSADPNYNGIAVASVAVTIADNDSGPSPGDTAVLTKQFGGARFDGATCTAVDNNGNVYVAGNTWGTVDAAHPNFDDTAGTADLFVAKYDRAGVLQWIRQFGDNTASVDDFATAVAIDNSSNVIVAGYTFGSLFAANQGESDYFVMKLDPATGNVTWGLQVGTTDFDEVWGLATDRNGNIYLAGGTRGGFGFSNQGDYDAFLASYTDNAALRWETGVASNGPDIDFARALAVDEIRGYLYVAGDFYTPKLLQDGTTIVHDSDIVVTRLELDTTTQLPVPIPAVTGTFVYGIVATDNTPQSSFAKGIAVDRSGDVFAAGYTIRRDQDDASNAGDVTFELFKLDRSLDMHLLWHSYKPAGEHAGNKALGVAVDSMGDVYLTGYVSIQLDPNGDPYRGGTDAFLMQFDGNSGATLWTRQFGTAGNDRAFGIAVDSNRPGDVQYVAGETSGSMDGNPNLGGYDAFMAQFDQLGDRL
jgi:hypothetical protein